MLIDGDVVVTDSAAICVYLADKHAEKGMGANPGLAGRAEMDGWMHFAQSEFEAPLWNKLRHRFILPKELRVDVGPAAAYDFAQEVKALDGRLGDRPFALGDRFSAVDVMLGDMGAWARAGKFGIASERVAAYFDRVLSRPARAPARRGGRGLLSSLAARSDAARRLPHPRGKSRRPRPKAPFDLAVLAHDERHLRRKVIELVHGDKVLVDFPEPSWWATGDVLVLDDGRHAEIIAAEEELLRGQGPRRGASRRAGLAHRQPPPRGCKSSRTAS